ncbi:MULTISPECIES: ABC transporter substrate-binding protein [unclassified Plantactinospora]|uniref:ABC transporter substrate-binding protein n=1 Tax=unclassified Plantactinospora TaxID=2631981 RepID=UPI000D16555F|nr:MULTISPECIES: ABC transporter substrate-binding protein [unclassified Plantactinospora]AVT31066.1 ABC transporter substrate-binding protein [Plantactinospora sp. BC1]AVT40049.1 ABC transporter substrate-binding protein [Plantactinospora sp. BB1]
MSQMDRRRALKLLGSLGALGATGLAAACGRDDGLEAEEPLSDEPVRIGMITAQSGVYRPIGDEMLRGFQLYLDLNDQRLGGHPVDLVVADEGETPESGRAALDQLVKQRVLALTGVVNSAVITGLRDAVEQAKIPLISSNASPSTLQSVVYIWRTSYINDEPGRALAPYVKNEIGANGKVSIIAPDYDAGRDSVQGFRQSFGESDARISAPVIWTKYFPGKPARNGFAPYIQQLVDRDPDAIYCFFSGESAIEFLKKLRLAGYRKQIYGPGFLTEGPVLDNLRKQEAQGIVTSLNYSADLNNAANRRFASAFRKAHGSTPTTYAMASYDAAQVLDKGIRIAGGNLTPLQLNLALGRIGQIDSPRGPWQFNQPRTPQQKWYLREVKPDGQVLSNVLISELATLG